MTENDGNSDEEALRERIANLQEMVSKLENDAAMFDSTVRSMRVIGQHSTRRFKQLREVADRNQAGLRDAEHQIEILQEKNAALERRTIGGLVRQVRDLLKRRVR